ncbi:MAG: methylglutaconyl-CoA hydratase [Halieaceae bacterium]|jgi:methylglutaconyl-CoA hydratase
MNNKTLSVSQEQVGVVSICLNRPEIHNAFDDVLIADISRELAIIAEDKTVRVVILRSAGKSFSAGADLSWMQRMAGYSYEANLADAEALAAMLNQLNSLPQITIARVQGAAFGGAVGLAACCDIVIASERASFCLSEVKLGLLPATISPYISAAIGPRACRRYFASGERFTAERAQELGLVSEMVSAEDLDQHIFNLADLLLKNGPEAIVQAKQLAFTVADRAIDAELVAETSALIANVRVSPEGQEGLSAFLEKRAPDWQQ